MNPWGVTSPSLDLVELARWNFGIARSKRAYYDDEDDANPYAARIAASQKQMRYQARKKAAK